MRIFPNTPTIEAQIMRSGTYSGKYWGRPFQIKLNHGGVFMATHDGPTFFGCSVREVSTKVKDFILASVQGAVKI